MEKIVIGAATVYGAYADTFQVVDELADAGFCSVEIVDERTKDFSRQEIDSLAKLGLNLSMHCPFVSLMYCHPNYNRAKPELEILRNSMQTALDMGCTDYVLHGGEIPLLFTLSKSRDYLLDLMIDRTKPIIEAYSKQGLKVHVENVSFGEQIGKQVSDIIKLQREIEGLGFCYDVAHGALTMDTQEILSTLKPDYLHLSDNRLKEDEHLALGDGYLPFRNILRLLYDFNGPVIIEAKSFDACVRSKLYLEDILKML